MIKLNLKEILALTMLAITLGLIIAYFIQLLI